jgi:diamine N-acetyltransferase
MKRRSLECVTRRKGIFVDLRLLTVDDAEITLHWRQSHRAQYLNAGATTIHAQKQWIAGRPSGPQASEMNFVIERKDGHPLGMLSLCNIHYVHRHAEPGRFLIGDEASARNIPAAVEAMKLLYELAFDDLQLVRLFGTVAEHNRLVIKWQRYLGMREEGRQRKHYYIAGKYQDAVCFGLLDEEYRALTVPRMRSLMAMETCVAATNGDTRGNAWLINESAW